MLSPSGTVLRNAKIVGIDTIVFSHHEKGESILRREELNMKKQLMIILLIATILVSSVNASAIMKPSLPPVGPLGGGLFDKTVKGNGSNSGTINSSNYGESTSPNPLQRVLDKQPSQDRSFSQWDFSNASEWSKLAYSDGNKTRLIVGLDTTEYKIVAVERLFDEYGARLVNSISIGHNNEALVVELSLSMVSAFTRDLQALNLIRYVEPDIKVRVDFVPNDPYWNLQWGPQKIQADWAWNTTLGNQSVLVAVVDTGIDYNHPDLSKNYVPLGYNWVDNNSYPLDDFGHGTHVAGIIAASINNSLGIAGLAQVRIMAEKSLDANGSGYDEWIAEGILHAAQRGAKIIGMSFGGPSDSQLVHDAIKAAYDNGSLLIAAAGNSNSNAKFYPAAYEEVVSVAATDQNDNKASFSNWGTWIELAAPGVSIYSTTPTYHVTLNNYGIGMNYDYMSGTSMACPHVSGVAALVWSLHPAATRDWVRLWLRYTADDLGVPGFDMYYGYGRINALKAVTESPPQHDVVAYSWSTPPFIRPGISAAVNATILNFGTSDEAGVTVNLLANSTTVNSTSVGLIAKGNSTQISLHWKPNTQGTYNLTLYVTPVVNQTNTENNVLSKYIYVGVPVKAVVLHSAGNVLSEIITNWQVLKDQWYLFGNKQVIVDYTTLDKQGITYSDIAATGADVLIISCAYTPYYGWEFTDSEIKAIEEYVHEGHGLIVTAGTFYSAVPNNNKLAPLLGLSENVSWSETGSDLMNLVNVSHPFLNKIPNPFIFPLVGTAVPSDGQWDMNELNGGTYIALGNSLESAIVTFRGLVYISSWLEIIPAYYHYPLQLVYNAITESKYQRPQHDLEVYLQCPQYLKPGESSLVNATVANAGLNDETSVVLRLLINGNQVANTTIANLTVGASRSVQYLWQPTKGMYNVTAYAPPVKNETYVANNEAVALVRVMEPLINPIEGQYANYEITILNFTEQWDIEYVHYVSPYQINITMIITMTSGSVIYMERAWIIVNVFTRVVEQDSGIGWIGMWYPGWVETNITMGSQLPIYYMNGTIVGSELVFINGRATDCWKVSISEYGVVYDFWYDKASGLWIAMKLGGSFYSYSVSEYLQLNTTNIPLGYAHDVAVMLNAPSITPPGQTVIVNTTVYNTGLKDETNITMQLIINGTTVDSELIPTVAFGLSDTVSYSWTPAVQGKCNVTAYVVPIPNESDTTNNIFTEFVKVGKVKGHVLFDQTHGTDDIVFYSTWTENLTSEGYVVDNFYGAITQATLEKYDAFVIPQATTAYSSSETYTLRNFVLAGHSLLVIGSNNPYLYTNLTDFAGITWQLASIGFGGFCNDLTSHPITDGVTSAFFLQTGLILSVASPAESIIRNPLGATMLAVSEVGYGKVVAISTGGSFTDSTIGNADNLRLAMNIIEWLVWKDTTPPSINIISPVNGTITKNTTLLVEWVGFDNDTRIHHYSVYLNGSLVADNLTTTNYTINGLTEGINNVTVVAYDMGKNTASSQVMVTVDLTPLSLRIINPTNGSYVKGLVWVNTTGSDEHFKLMTLYIDGHLDASYNSTGAYAYVWNTTSLGGQHTILLKAVDQAGNTAQARVQVAVDNTMPLGEIMQPLNATYVRGVIGIQVYSYDQDLESTRVFIDQILLQNWGNETNIHQTNWNATAVPEGIHTITLSVMDKAGNILNETVTVTVDNTNPQVSISAPVDSSTVDGTVSIGFAATDTNIRTVLLYIDNAVYNVTGQTAYSWDSQQVSDGSHLIKVVATDKAGNTGQAQVTVTTTNIETNYVSRIAVLSKNNTALLQSVTQLQYVIAGVIVAAAVVIILTFVALRRKPSAPKRTKFSAPE
jgi:thermitase